MGYFEFENRVKTWIEDHRASWYFILGFLGMSLGMFGGYLFGADLQQRLLMGISYTVILLLVEYYAGGSR